MKKPILLLFILAEGSAIKAQSDSISKSKNEIGVNVLPAICVLYYSVIGDVNIYYGAFYKRRITKNGQARILMDYSPLSLLRENSRYFRTTINDSVEVYDNWYYHNHPTWAQIKIGYEWIRNKKRVAFFGGADVFYNFKKYSITHTRDSILTRIIYPPAPNAGVYSYTLSNRNIGTYNYCNRNLGLAIFFGIKNDILKHWFISADIGFNLNFYVWSPSYTHFGCGIDFHSPSILNNISIAYRF